MNTKNTIISALAILVILAFGLIYMNQMRLKQKEAVMEEQLTQFNQQQELLVQAQLEMKQEKDETERLAMQAEEAKKMAEAQAEKERLERERLVAELNERLKREAAERRAAEAAQQALTEKMAALEQAQQEAQTALAKLEKAKREATVEVEQEVEQETVALKEKIENQKQTMVALMQENETLKQQQQKLEEKQIATEEAIMNAGGKIEIPYPEIRSPNVRRKQAIYFKERVLGIPDGI